MSSGYVWFKIIMEMIGNKEVIAIKIIITSSCIFIHDINVHRYVLDSWFKGRLGHSSASCFVFLSDISTTINFLIHILLERCNQAAIHDPPFSSDFVGFHGNLFNFLQKMTYRFWCLQTRVYLYLCDISFFIFHCITTRMLCYILLLIINKVKCVTFKTA